jgi:MinD-like ATPase involved in chromosome partitioning or flagellar assembly
VGGLGAGIFEPDLHDRMDDFPRFRPNLLDESPPEARSRARVLRRLQVLGAGRWHPPLGRRAGARVLVVCGQAGAGKSTVAANLAIALAGLRSRVVLVDLDLRHPVQHRIFGIASPVAGLHTLLEDEVDTMEQAMAPTPVRNLFLVTSDTARPPVRPTPERQRRLLKQIFDLDADVVIADVSADVSPDDGESLVDLLGPSALRLVVSAPDLRSIRAAYNFLRGQVAHAIEHATGGTAEGVAMAAALGRSSAPPMHELMARLQEHAPPNAVAAVLQALESFGGRLIGNRALRSDEADLLHATARLVADYLGVATPVLGILERNEQLAATSALGRPLLLGTGIDRNVRLFHSMAEQLLVDGNDGESLASDPDRGTPLRGLGGRDGDAELPGAAASGTEPPLPAPLTSYMRRYPRHPVDWHARYVSAQGRDVDVRVFDISQSGASIEAIPGFELGGAGRLTFTQIEGQPTVEVTVKEGNRPMGRVGVHFESSLDLCKRLAEIARLTREDPPSAP